jgi:hypothetical protein
MADASVIDIDVSAVMEKLGRGRSRGSKNKSKDLSMVASSSATPMKRRSGHPLGSKNRSKPSCSAARKTMGASTAPCNASPPPHVNIFSFFVIAGAQCHEQQRVPLMFTKFMDGRKLCEAILRKEFGGGTPYEVEVYYNGRGKMYFRGGRPQFAEDHELHQVLFMVFNYHCGTSKFDMKIFDCTQCQKKYEAEVHFQ